MRSRWTNSATVGRMEADDRILIAESATSRVFLASDRRYGPSDVIIKVARSKADDSLIQHEVEVSRFLEGVRGVAPILDSGRDDRYRNRAFLVRPYYRMTLQDAGRMGAPDAASTGLSLAETLSDLHDRDVVHGDIKPGNIALDVDGQVVVIDLSTALVRGELSVETGFTPAYAAPEVLANGFAKPAADVFGFGGILFFLLTGRAPHGDSEDSLAAMVARARRGEIAFDSIPPGAPSELRDLVIRCLSSEVAARPSWSEVIRSLASVVAQSEVGVDWTVTSTTIRPPIGLDHPGPLTGQLNSRLAEAAEAAYNSSSISALVSILGVLAGVASALLVSSGLAIASSLGALVVTIWWALTSWRARKPSLDPDSRAWLQSTKDSWESAVSGSSDRATGGEVW